MLGNLVDEQHVGAVFPDPVGIRVGGARVLLDQAAATEGNQGRRQGFAHDATRRREALLLNSSEILAKVRGDEWPKPRGTVLRRTAAVSFSRSDGPTDMLSSVGKSEVMP